MNRDLHYREASLWIAAQEKLILSAWAVPAAIAWEIGTPRG